MRLTFRRLSLCILALLALSGGSENAIAQEDRTAIDESLLGSLEPSDDPDEPLSGFYNTADLSLVITGGNSAATTIGLRNLAEYYWENSSLRFDVGGLSTESRSREDRVAVETGDGGFEVVEAERQKKLEAGKRSAEDKGEQPASKRPAANMAIQAPAPRPKAAAEPEKLEPLPHETLFNKASSTATCVMACGRTASKGFSTCCRSCKNTNAKRHGPKCEEYNAALDGHIVKKLESDMAESERYAQKRTSAEEEPAGREEGRSAGNPSRLEEGPRGHERE